MVIYQSPHLRIFNGEGYDKEKLLLLKYFNNYSIKQWLKTINKIQLILKIKININILIFILTSLTYFDFKLINSITNKYLKVFFRQKLLNIYLLKIFKSFFIGDFIFNKFFENKLLITSLFPLKVLGGKDISPFLNNNFIPNRFKGLVSDSRLKKNIYRKEYLKPIKNFYNKIENLNNKNIFIVGQSYDFYRGSITPFYNSKFSWFASTGLKTDVECNNLEVGGILKKKPVRYLYSDLCKDIIFKLVSFKSRITNQVKKKSRHLFFYNAHNFLGLQRFISESNSSFNYKQNNNYLLNIQFIQFFFKSSIKFSKVFIKNFRKFNLKRFKKNNKRFTFLYNNSFNFTKILFFLFQSIKRNLNYYYFLKEGISIVTKATEVNYRTLISFINLEKEYFKTITFLIKFFCKKCFNKNFFLRNLNINLTKINNYVMFFNIFLNLYIIYKNFLSSINKYINKKEFLRFFFEIFLINKVRLILRKKLYDEEISIEEQIKLKIKLLKKNYWYKSYKKQIYYIYFCLDLKFNLENQFLSNYNSYYNYIKNEAELLKPFSDLKLKWHFSRYAHLKDFFFFFSDFLDNLILSFRKFFYFSKIKFKNIFILSNIYLYLFNRKKNDILGDDILLSNSLKSSGIFLGKWFYYRQINSFSDSLVDSYYYETKPFKGLGFNILESNIYNLNRYFSTKSNLKFFNFKLDLFFRSNLSRKDYNLKNITQKFSLINKSNLVNKIYSKIYKLRSFFWSRNLIKVVNNSFRSLVNFNLPNLPRYNKDLVGYSTLATNFKTILKGRKGRKVYLSYKHKLLNSFFIDEGEDNCFSQTFLLLYTNKFNYLNSENYYFFWFK